MDRPEPDTFRGAQWGSRAAPGPARGRRGAGLCAAGPDGAAAPRSVSCSPEESPRCSYLWTPIAAPARALDPRPRGGPEEHAGAFTLVVVSRGPQGKPSEGGGGHGFPHMLLQEKYEVSERYSTLEHPERRRGATRRAGWKSRSPKGARGHQGASGADCEAPCPSGESGGNCRW